MPKKKQQNYALIVAAGRGYRAGGEIPKQYRPISGTPMLRFSANSFAKHSEIDHLYVVVHPDDREFYSDALEGLSCQIVFGGKERQDSVRLGLEAINDAASDNDIVLIHDAARPFLSHDMISDCLSAMEANSAVIPALKVVDTIKHVEDETIRSTVDRDSLRAVQTPQCFRIQDIYSAHNSVIGQELTDDASVAESYGLDVVTIEGSKDNFKVTTVDDFDLAERKLSMSSISKLPRMATGFDVHAFEDGDAVTLCGVAIPHSQKLKGHSDADVAMHALTDALLGCICAGDIGSHFPPSDPQWKGVASEVFLKHAGDLIAKKGGIVNHVDVTIICEAPKVGPHKVAMRESLARILSLSVDQVSVKATTTEKLGFTGRQEGIAAQAAATILI